MNAETPNFAALRNSTTSTETAAARPNLDADLFALISEYHQLVAKEIEGEDENGDVVDLSGHLLPKILASQPQTISGAVAKMQVGLSPAECERNLSRGCVLDDLGYRAILDLYRLT